MRLRRGWPRLAAAALAVLVPLTELWLLIEVGRAIGALPTVLILVGQAVLGGWLIRRTGRRAWQSVNEAYRTGQLPSTDVGRASWVLLGGALLMLPGFLTDVAAAGALIPGTRRLVARAASRLVSAGLRSASGPAGPFDQRGVVIEGETVETPTGTGAGAAQAAPEESAQPLIIEGELDNPDRR